MAHLSGGSGRIHSHRGQSNREFFHGRGIRTSPDRVQLIQDEALLEGTPGRNAQRSWISTSILERVDGLRWEPNTDVKGALQPIVRWRASRSRVHRASRVLVRPEWPNMARPELRLESICLFGAGHGPSHRPSADPESCPRTQATLELLQRDSPMRGNTFSTVSPKQPCEPRHLRLRRPSGFTRASGVSPSRDPPKKASRTSRRSITPWCAQGDPPSIRSIRTQPARCSIFTMRGLRCTTATASTRTRPQASRSWCETRRQRSWSKHLKDSFAGWTRRHEWAEQARAPDNRSRSQVTRKPFHQT